MEHQLMLPEPTACEPAHLPWTVLLLLNVLELAPDKK